MLTFKNESVTVYDKPSNTKWILEKIREKEYAIHVDDEMDSLESDTYTFFMTKEAVDNLIKALQMIKDFKPSSAWR